MTPLYHEMSLASRKIRAESRLSSLDFHPALSKPSTRSRLRTSAVQSSSRSALSQNLPQEAAFLLPLLNLRHGQLLLEIFHKKPLARFRRSISAMVGFLPRSSPQKDARLPPKLPSQSSFRQAWCAVLSGNPASYHSISITIGSSSTASVGILWIWSTGPTARPFSSKRFGSAVSSKGRPIPSFIRRTAFGRPG